MGERPPVGATKGEELATEVTWLVCEGGNVVVMPPLVVVCEPYHIYLLFTSIYSYII